MIYFDNAATSLIKPQAVKDAVNFALTNLTANAGRSGHKPAQQTAQAVYETREAVLKFFNAKNYQVIFTKNCTEALNLAILGSLTKEDHVITTCYEHNSVLRPLFNLKQQGLDVTILDCNLEEVHKHVEQHLKPNTKMLIVTAASNVTGECSNIYELKKVCLKNNIKLLVDGAQSSGHMQINLDEADVTFYTFAGHKGLGSITGVGGLLVKKGTSLKPITFGGTGTESENLTQPTDLPEGYEAGTIPTIPIVSLLAGINDLQKNYSSILKAEENLSKFLYTELSKLNFIKLYSTNKSKNVFTVNILNLDSAFVANVLDEEFNICVRAGLHCAPLIHKKLGTTLQGAVRVSLDYNNTYSQINYLIYALKQIYIKYC